jgi:hypothetical protein
VGVADFDSLRFLDKLAELISQKLLHLEEQLFMVVSNLKVIWYNPTYAFKKPHFFVSGSRELSHIMQKRPFLGILLLAAEKRKQKLLINL